MSNLTSIIKDSFLQFSGAVLQSRALTDARDNMKPSARQIFYCMYTDGFVHSKPFKKTLKAIGSAFRVYIHGDSSAEGIIMRAAQPFAYRYPLVEVEGSSGTLIAANSYAAPRYTSSRLSELSEYLFADLDKDTIQEWRDNYDDTEKYPMVLPCKGFYPIVNGNFGLGVGMSSSIPQYNLNEVNKALIKLLWNPDISFDEIYVAPDFATGGIIINGEEVKESHKNGRGSACKIRSAVTYDSKERCLIVTEIPYMVYTNTICAELESIINGEENPGIDRFNDLTGATPLIKIYLTKSANPDKVIKYLFKNTSLQNYYGINFTMLENGRYPKIFTWKQLLQAHLEHEREVYIRAFNFDLKKIKTRLLIIEGLLKAINDIDNVIKAIKASLDTKAANKALQQLLDINETQAKAILDIKLSRLAHLEVSKIQKEQSELFLKKEQIELILNDDNLLKKQIEKGLVEVANKFGDNRRTKIINISKENDEEPTEIRTLQISISNKNNIYLSEASSLYIQKRGGVGNKAKLGQGEYIIHSEIVESNEEIAFFTNNGNFYHYPASMLSLGEKIAVETLFEISQNENIVAISAFNKKNLDKYIMFFTKNGLIKKSEMSEYNLKRSGSLKAISLEKDDEIVSIQFINDEDIGIMTTCGNFIQITTKDIRPIGRIAKGIKGIKLNAGDFVCSAQVISSNTKYIISVTSLGLSKKTRIEEFSIQGKNTKGAKIQKLSDNDTMADFIAINNENEILFASSKSCIKVTLNDIPTLSRGTLGVKIIKMDVNDKIIGISLA